MILKNTHVFLFVGFLGECDFKLFKKKYKTLLYRGLFSWGKIFAFYQNKFISWVLKLPCSQKSILYTKIAFTVRLTILRGIEFTVRKKIANMAKIPTLYSICCWSNLNRAPFIVTKGIYFNVFTKTEKFWLFQYIISYLDHLLTKHTHVLCCMKYFNKLPIRFSSAYLKFNKQLQTFHSKQKKSDMLYYIYIYVSCLCAMDGWGLLNTKLEQQYQFHFFF